VAALNVGTSAPDFKLSSLHGAPFSLHDALKKGPVVAAFFKVSCPVCQLAFPYLERIYKTQDASRVTIVGISQNDAKDTEKFMTQFGVTFPVLLDDPKSYAASNAYGLTNVPTIFWIADDGTIEVSSVGWVKKEIEEIHRRVSEIYSQLMSVLFRPDEKIVEFRAG
jgi:peroxiredoxin